MSLRHAILVLLQDQEASGYDLAREFANSIGLVWNATHQQIYLELGKLNEQHMVSFRHVPQEGKPDKKLYSITEDGRQELIRWLKKPAGPSPGGLGPGAGRRWPGPARAPNGYGPARGPKGSSTRHSKSLTFPLQGGSIRQH